MQSIQQIDLKDLTKIQRVEYNYDLEHFMSGERCDLGSFKFEMPDNSLSGVGIKQGDIITWTNLFDFEGDEWRRDPWSGERFLHVLSLSTGDLVVRILEYGGNGFSTIMWCDPEYHEMELVHGEFDIVGKVTDIKQ